MNRRAPRRLMSWRAAAAVLRHPSLWMTAFGQAARLAPRSWWQRRPWVPVPPASYVAFRLQTQHGTDTDGPTPADLVAYLRWCRDWNRYRPS